MEKKTMAELKAQHEKYKDKTMKELIKERKERLKKRHTELREKYKHFLGEVEEEEIHFMDGKTIADLKAQHEKYKDKTMQELIKMRKERLAEGQNELRAKYKHLLIEGEEEVVEGKVNLKQAERLMGKIYYNAKHLGNVNEFEVNEIDVEEHFRGNQMKVIAAHLLEAVKLYEYIDTPVRAEGTLYQRSDGRYGIKDTDIYFASGDTIEYWDEGYGSYELSRIEYKDDDYYIVGMHRGQIAGLKVRIRAYEKPIL
ncbi:DUF5348 domain-containing protein [Viridibacillus arvi]|uniref:DUF5348 domain-containing protein n=1 Tax=Viridibacillus arvi TaxID=263475 RepID=UPI003697A2D0